MKIFATDIIKDGVPNAALDYPTITLDEIYWFIFVTDRDMIDVREELLSNGDPGGFTMYGAIPSAKGTPDIDCNQFLVASNDPKFESWMYSSYSSKINPL